MLAEIIPENLIQYSEDILSVRNKLLEAERIIGEVRDYLHDSDGEQFYYNKTDLSHLYEYLSIRMSFLVIMGYKLNEIVTIYKKCEEGIVTEVENANVSHNKKIGTIIPKIDKDTLKELFGDYKKE